MNFLNDLDFRKKRALVRVDFNVPQDSKGNIVDDSRIRASLKTIKYLLKKNSKVILISHLGDPQGKKDNKLSLKKVSERLSELLRKKVCFINDCVGKKVENKIKSLNYREIIFLENLRFHQGEEKNDVKFAKQLASLADVFVNDAFSVSHRNHASVVGIAKFLPCCAGFLMEEEIKMLSRLNYPKHPFVLIMGGKKISTKIKLIKNLLKTADCVLIGGAMMFTFYKSNNINVGKSFVEKDQLAFARILLRTSQHKIILPIDVATNNGIKNYSDMLNNDVGLDIGSKTIEIYKQIISQAKTIVWNGPLGMFEIARFSKGTKEIIKSIINNKHCFSVAGGGETVDFINNLRLKNKFSYISSGGGAMLSFLEGTKLPGIKALETV